MTISPIAAGATALGGYLLLSLGMTLEKRNVSWIGFAGPRDACFRRARLGWLAGFTLVNIVPAFNYVALLGLPPNVVGAAAGASVAFTALLAAPLLGERIGARRLIWSAALLAAIVVAALRGSAGPGGLSAAFSPGAIYAALALPVAAAALGLVLRRGLRGEARGRTRVAILLAGSGGAFSGFMVLPMRAVQIAAGGDPLRWLSTPFPYLFAVGGVGGFVFAQYAFKDGEMSTVAPVYYGMQVLWPALASYFVFAAPFDLPPAAAFAAVAVSIAMIAREGGGRSGSAG